MYIQETGNTEGGSPFVERPELEDVKRSLHYEIITQLGGRDIATVTADQVIEIARDRVRPVAEELNVPLSAADREAIVQSMVDEVLGLGPIEEFMRDPDVTEVMVNNPDNIYIERHGKIYKTNKRFLDEGHLLRIIDKIVSQVGRRIDEASPMVDARLPDGSRVNAVIHPLAVNGPMLTIRKFSREAYTPEDFLRLKTVTPEALVLLEAAVKGRLNIVISGGTGTGKTTTLNMLSSFIPNDERIITIEDSVELKLQQEHVLRLEARPPNIEGKGEVTIRDLVRNALRMRPDRIIVGEARGAEALDMLQAMNTGHDGSMTTIHSNSPRDTLARIETMVLMAGMDLTLNAVRGQIASAIDVIIHQMRLKDGTRRITNIVEVQGMEGDTVTLSDIFLFDFGMGIDEHGNFKGKLKATGIRPRFLEKLQDFGVEVPLDIFEPEVFSRA
jgi:pilus assembly protein CpaF